MSLMTISVSTGVLKKLPLERTALPKGTVVAETRLELNCPKMRTKEEYDSTNLHP